MKIPEISSNDFNKYDPYSILQSLRNSTNPVDIPMKKLITKYLFGGNGIAFDLDRATNIIIDMHQGITEERERQLIQQMLVHAVKNGAVIKRLIVDALFLTWFTSYIPAQRRNDYIENNPIRLNNYKAVLTSTAEFFKGNGFTKTYLGLKDKELSQNDAYVFIRAFNSVFVLLYHLNHYGKLEVPMEYYLEWLENSGYQWFNVDKDTALYSVLDCLAWNLPREIPIIGGKRFYYPFVHVEEFQDYFDEYKDCPMVKEMLQKFQSSSQREHVRSLMKYKYE